MLRCCECVFIPFLDGCCSVYCVFLLLFVSKTVFEHRVCVCVNDNDMKGEWQNVVKANVVKAL